MILHRCSCCKKLFAIDNAGQGNVFKVRCPNNNCSKTYIVHENSVVDIEEMSILGIFHEIENFIIPNITNLDEEELNMLIKELSTKSEIGNILISELINSLLSDESEMLLDEREFFVPRLEEKAYSLKNLFENLDKRISQDAEKFQEGNLSLKIANQCIQNLQKEKENLMGQIEYMEGVIHDLKHQIEKYE